MNAKMFSPLIYRNLKFLRDISTCGRSKNAIVARLNVAKDEELLCFVEICLNLLKGRLPLRKRWMRRLRAQAALIRKLSRARSAHKTRQLLTKRLKDQSGDGLPALAGVLASILVPIIAEKMMSKNE